MMYTYIYTDCRMSYQLPLAIRVLYSTQIEHFIILLISDLTTNYLNKSII